ncbi:hypothetical protein NTG1052_180002 [Candidatus Nitrotoga sp. 1052]|nr:hypothetical protein NTG1052_180002 [Candidatus Nitrotoga sp. 1052]
MHKQFNLVFNIIKFFSSVANLALFHNKSGSRALHLHIADVYNLSKPCSIL